jgi:hypothetical protein
MIPSSIIAAERELRCVIERRQGCDIPGCLAAYCELAENQVKSLPPGDPIRLQICESVLSVLKWAGLVLRIRRATLAQDLRLLRKADRFLSAKVSAGPRFRLDL